MPLACPMSLIALTLVAALQVQDDPRLAQDSASERARTAELAASDVDTAVAEADRLTEVAALMAGDEWAVAADLRQLLDDREAACRQARMIQRWADEGAGQLEGDTAPGFDQFALIHLWAGFTVNRNCGGVGRAAAGD